MVHVFWAERYGLNLSEERNAEVQLRSMERRLSRTLALDPGALTMPRMPEQKIVGNCRDFSVTLASMLQAGRASTGHPVRGWRIPSGSFPSNPTGEVPSC